MDGSEQNQPSRPLWLLAELSYRCPLQCTYCSNPVDFARHKAELSTEEWLRVLKEGRELGAAQLGFSGGEPLLRKDLEQLVGEARNLGFYSNLITSGMGMDEARLGALKKAGLDHIQLSFQASSADLNDYIGGAKSFEHKKALAQLIKQHEYPMVLNVVIHRHNIDSIEHILDMALDLGADYIELANVQFEGWAQVNRAHLLPTREQVERSEAIALEYRERVADRMKVFYVVPDYFQGRPKPCMSGWGNIFMIVAPDGIALPCHGARQLPGMNFPSVREATMSSIWNESADFNKFRGDAWMSEPCRTCPEKANDFGGCRCQAFLLTGDAANTDPACNLSSQHDKILQAVEQAATSTAEPIFRNVRNSKALTP